MKKRKEANKKMPKLKIRRGDVVQVISGKDKGTTGKILSIDRQKERVVVEGINMVKKHVKPNQNNPQGGIVSMEAPIHYSNVLLFCKESNKGERVRIKNNDDGTKTRVFAKSGVVAD